MLLPSECTLLVNWALAPARAVVAAALSATPVELSARWRRLTRGHISTRRYHLPFVCHASSLVALGHNNKSNLTRSDLECTKNSIFQQETKIYLVAACCGCKCYMIVLYCVKQYTYRKICKAILKYLVNNAVRNGQFVI